MSNQPKVFLRPANEEDISFIFNSWLRSFRTSFFARSVVNSIYFTEQHKVIENCLKTSECIVACNPDYPSQVYGWICAEKIDGIFCLHYLYVKHDFRKLGIARILFNAFEHGEGAGIFTHYTKSCERLSIKLNLIYHPYILFSTYSKKENV